MIRNTCVAQLGIKSPAPVIISRRPVHNPHKQVSIYGIKQKDILQNVCYIKSSSSIGLRFRVHLLCENN